MKFTDKVWGATLVSYNVGSSEWFVVNQKVRHCAVPATVKFVVVLYMRTHPNALCVDFDLHKIRALTFELFCIQPVKNKSVYFSFFQV